MSQATVSAAQILSELDEIVLARWSPEVFRRFQCVWLTHVLDLSAQEIAKALDLNISTVRRIRTEFLREGVRAIDGKGNRGGRRNECMSFEEETSFLRNHPELFNRAGVADVGALKEAFEAHVGRKIHKTTVYRFLERHGRKRGSSEGGRPGGEVASTAANRKKAPAPKRKGSRTH